MNTPTLIVKKFDNFLRDYWYHCSIDGVKTELVDVESQRGQEITTLLANAPQGKRYVSSKSFGVEKWELVDLPPTTPAEPTVMEMHAEMETLLAQQTALKAQISALQKKIRKAQAVI